MTRNKWILVWLALLLPSVGYAEKPKWVEQKNTAKKAGESVDWKAERDQWKASKSAEVEQESERTKDKAKSKVKEKEQQAAKGKQKEAKELKNKSAKTLDDQERQQGKPDMSGKMQDKPMKELDKGAEQGQQSREQRKKWWQFW